MGPVRRDAVQMSPNPTAVFFCLFYAFCLSLARFISGGKDKKKEVIGWLSFLSDHLLSCAAGGEAAGTGRVRGSRDLLVGLHTKATCSNEAAGVL